MTAMPPPQTVQRGAASHLPSRARSSALTLSWRPPGPRRSVGRPPPLTLHNCTPFGSSRLPHAVGPAPGLPCSATEGPAPLRARHPTGAAAGGLWSPPGPHTGAGWRPASAACHHRSAAARLAAGPFSPLLPLAAWPSRRPHHHSVAPTSVAHLHQRSGVAWAGSPPLPAPDGTPPPYRKLRLGPPGGGGDHFHFCLAPKLRRNPRPKLALRVCPKTAWGADGREGRGSAHPIPKTATAIPQLGDAGGTTGSLGGGGGGDHGPPTDSDGTHTLVRARSCMSRVVGGGSEEHHKAPTDFGGTHACVC